MNYMNNPLHHYKAEFFKTLGHAVRLGILDALRDGPLSVGELQTITGTEQSVLSQHLAKLRSMKFVSSRREKTTIYYHVHDQDVYQFLDLARAIYARQLGQSKLLLEELEAVGVGK
jgi:DNA-binding transcriptional ArsR family regulator